MSPQFSVYVIFPNIAHERRTTTYLTINERRLWVDRILLPAIRHCCPVDVIQHHPRSFEDAESKACSRRREACSGLVQNDVDMHHYLPEENLQAIWEHAMQKVASEDLTSFRDMFIVLSAKNMKLEAKSRTFHSCREKILSHLNRILNWSKADLSNCWIDIGIEDTANTRSKTFLLRRACLEHWIDSMKRDQCSRLISSKLFNWNLTGQAGSARVETRKTHPLRYGGIAYAQRYNLNKDLFFTSVRSEYGVFGEPHLEGITCPPSLLDAWIVAARQNRNAGIATASSVEPKLDRIRKAFSSTAFRIKHALESSLQTSFGVREEYRISWALFIDADPTNASGKRCHVPFFVLPTAEVNSFMRWEFNRWIAAIEFVRWRGSRQGSTWEDHQRNMIMATILLRSLKANVNCHHVAKRSQLFRSEYRNKRGESLRGLDFDGSMRLSGLAWLPSDIFDWSILSLHDDLVGRTTFTFNGLRSIFRNWKAVGLASRNYGAAKELEARLQNARVEDRHVIIDRMKKMVYQHFALQVIQQLKIGPHLEENHPVRQGLHGLSFYVVYVLVGEAPTLARTRPGSHGLGNTYAERLQTIFDWDDGIPRTFWEHCFYRQLAQSFYRAILASSDTTEAEEWKRSLGERALPYFWIIPQFDRHSMFCRPKKADSVGTCYSFVSGMLKRSYDESGYDLSDKANWMLGGDDYLPGWPNHVTAPSEQRIKCADTEEQGERRYSINFGCPFPFSEIPPLIEDGFRACRQAFARGDQRVLAHYELARKCLGQALGDPLCDLLLLIVLTICSSSDRLDVRPGEDCFSVSDKSNNPALLAACLTTRTLWFLRPEVFSWKENTGQVLSVHEMAKKIGEYSEPSTACSSH